jgi:hypothetical protein
MIAGMSAGEDEDAKPGPGRPIRRNEAATGDLRLRIPPSLLVDLRNAAKTQSEREGKKVSVSEFVLRLIERAVRRARS